MIIAMQPGDGPIKIKLPDGAEIAVSYAPDRQETRIYLPKDRTLDLSAGFVGNYEITPAIDVKCSFERRATPAV